MKRKKKRLKKKKKALNLPLASSIVENCINTFEDLGVRLFQYYWRVKYLGMLAFFVTLDHSSFILMF